MAIIDYVKGELVTPEGKKVKKITEGSVPTDQATLTAPVNVGAGNYYAPNFGSNQTLDYEFYADDPVPAPEAPAPETTPTGEWQPMSGVRDPSQDSGSDTLAQQMETAGGAGAIPDFGSWAGAVMTGAAPVGAGGPITAALGQATGEIDFTKDYNNYAVTDPEGWKAALAEATAQYPNQPQLIQTAAANIMASKGNAQDAGVNNVSAPSSSGVTAGQPSAMGDPNFKGNLGDQPVSESPANFAAPQTSSAKAPGSYQTAASPAGGANGNRGGDRDRGPSAGGKAGADPKSGSGGSGGFGGPGPAGGSGGFEEGGYVPDYEQGVPTSMRQNYRRPAAQTAPQQQPNGNAGYKQGGMVTKQAVPAAPPSRTQRYAQSRATGGFVAAKGFADGGVVPRQGYQDGGEVDRFNPPPAAIAPDGVVDNQPINADEGEYVIQRESAEILGPEILNALNDPMMAKAFSDMFDAALGLDAGMSSEGASPAPGLPPKRSATPTAPAGASLANDNGPDMPMAFRKGGYVKRR